MTKAIIHINRQFLAMNAKDGGKRPVITVKRAGKTRYARGILIHGPSQMLPDDGKQLACGARVWVETDAEVTLIEECSFAEAKVAA